MFRIVYTFDSAFEDVTFAATLDNACSEALLLVSDGTAEYAEVYAENDSTVLFQAFA